jgi:hypothetical protein
MHAIKEGPPKGVLGRREQNRGARYLELRFFRKWWVHAKDIQQAPPALASPSLSHWQAALAPVPVVAVPLAVMSWHTASGSAP